MFGFCIDGDLIFWIVFRALTILINLLKELVIFGIIDDLSSRGKANTIMCTNLGDDAGGEMKANTMYFPGEFMPGSMRCCLDRQQELSVDIWVPYSHGKDFVVSTTGKFLQSSRELRIPSGNECVSLGRVRTKGDLAVSVSNTSGEIFCRSYHTP